MAGLNAVLGAQNFPLGRDFQIFGEALVRVRGNGNLGSGGGSMVWELGLTEGPITIIPVYRHSGIFTADFGPDVPVDIQYMLEEVRIITPLIHYDPRVLSWVQAESRGGVWTNHGPKPDPTQLKDAEDWLILGEGTFVGAGCVLGNGLPLLTSGNHFVRMTIESAQLLYNNWRFLACYLPAPPMIIPVGTQKTRAEIEWRVIPYCPIYQSGGSSSSGGVLLNVDGKTAMYSPAKEARSSGTILWDRGQP